MSAPALHFEFPLSLPINERKADIEHLIQSNQVVIIAGETGSGKTTQLPKMLLSMGRGESALIGHTQPRRLAARSVAARISSELGCELGSAVGYQVRFTDQVTDQTRLKLMTDGILLAEIQHDRLLKRYDTLIIDEAHERSLNIDFLLGYLRRLLPKRPDLKVIITSATIDVERFSDYFNGAPIIEVEGRTYPVDVQYAPSADDGIELTDQVVDQLGLIDQGHYGKRGDVLVFLPGEREIRDVAKALKGSEQYDVLPLYARLSASEQNRVFQTASRRGIRVVLSTNVAETSLTVPGIRYVIDSGLARISRYSYRSKLQRLPIEPISQASANQRKGRCGRVAEGVCIRLYDEADFQARSEFTDPEIKRTNLAQVILQMRLLRLGDVARFPFIEPPDPRLIRDGFRLLEELGAVDKNQDLTALGYQLARLPLDPRLGRMLVAATDRGVLAEVLLIVSALAVQDPRERPGDKREQSDTAHRRFEDDRSDFLAWINTWRYLETQREELSGNQFKKLCQKEFFNYLRVREWRDTHRQLLLACKANQWRVGPIPAELDYEAIHRSLLAGLLGFIATHHEGPEYEGARQQKLRIFPASTLHKKRQKWLMAAEIVETSQVYARTCAAIEPEWALDINPGLLKYHYYEPRWQMRSGRVMAYQRISLYGLTLVDKQSIHFGPIDPVAAREVFIRDALVAQRLKPAPNFMRHNARLMTEVLELEDKTRRRDLVATEDSLSEFYSDRLPDGVYSGATLGKALKRDGGLNDRLKFSRSQLLVNTLADSDVAQFPDTWEWRELKLRLRYQFEPGKQRDGVTLIVPLALVNRLPRYLPEWLVPGMLQDKLISLVKTLPKRLRKQLVPVPDKVAAAMKVMQPADEPLLQALAQALRTTAGVAINPDDFSEESLEAYYRMNVQILDDQGQIHAEGRDLRTLVESLRSTEHVEQVKVGPAFEKSGGHTQWNFEDLAPQVQFKQAGTLVTSFPALKDSGDSVSVELFDYPETAEVAHRLGLLRLAKTSDRGLVRDLQRHAFRSSEAQKALLSSGVERGILLDAMISMALLPSLRKPSGELLRTKVEFQNAVAANKRAIIDRTQRYEKLLLQAATHLGEARTTLAKLPSHSELKASEGDARQHLERLLAIECWLDWPEAMFEQLPRYAKGLAWRLGRLQSQLPKDQKSVQILEPLEQQWREIIGKRASLAVVCEPVCAYHWMLEEFRVSLFAQQLGTKMPVSEKRLTQQWDKVKQWVIENPL